MDEAARARAEARRGRMRGIVVRSFAELEAAGIEFWQGTPSSARLEAMWQLIVEAWVLEGSHGTPPRFVGSVVGVGRFEG
jgi:hypothetical protein